MREPIYRDRPDENWDLLLPLDICHILKQNGEESSQSEAVLDLLPHEVFTELEDLVLVNFLHTDTI